MGAGLSGIGAAYHFKKQFPNKSFVILEGRKSMGGTWDLFQYPGIRSDSDMYTLGYNFKPWKNPKVIADGPSILSYIKETAHENQIEDHILYGRKIKEMSWSSVDSRWTVTCENVETEVEETFECQYLQSCLGYYNYEKGHTPEFKGSENFKGTIIHPQFWNPEFDYSGKKVVVIGSGATAITLVPALSDKAEKVTMLQRSPTYIFSIANKSIFPNKLNQAFPKLMYKVNRSVLIMISIIQYQLSRRYPDMMKRFFIKKVKQQLPEGFDVEKHFTPRYNPWEERLCVVPNGDLFKALKKGKVEVVTDHIDTFTENGIKLKSGEEIIADIIVTATGLDVKVMGGLKIAINGEHKKPTDGIVYKGMMLKDIPNFCFVVGYTNASWTLKADLVSNYFCRLIQETENNGKQVFWVTSDEPIEKEPIIDFKSGYVQRAIKEGKLPYQGSKAPWKLKQNYLYDAYNLKIGKLKDKYLRFG
jgi:cation diffusion facilitator CzcD-associated flavoprotein CzcO